MKHRTAPLLARNLDRLKRDALAYAHVAFARLQPERLQRWIAALEDLCNRPIVDVVTSALGDQSVAAQAPGSNSSIAFAG